MVPESEMSGSEGRLCRNSPLVLDAFRRGAVQQTMALQLVRMNETRSSDEIDDRQLVERIVAGDQSSFEELVRRKTSKVYALSYRVAGNAEDAKDVAQLVFLRLWENVKKYDPQYAFDTWLYRIVTNVGIDFLRAKQTRDNAVNSSLRLVRTSTDAEQGTMIQHKEIEQIFEDAATVLSPTQKTVFIMREMEDISSAEISRILGCRESTVRNHLFSARKLLKKHLQQRYPEYARLWEGRR